MSMYLNGNQNVKGRPNENYAREFMELFCLGPKAPDGTDELHAGRRRGPRQGAHRLAAELDRRQPRLRQGHVQPRHTSSPAPRRSSGQTIPALGRAADAADGPPRVNAALDAVLAPPEPRAVPDPQAVGRVHRHAAPRRDARRAVRRSTPPAAALRPLLRGDPRRIR